MINKRLTIFNLVLLFVIALLLLAAFVVYQSRQTGLKPFAVDKKSLPLPSNNFEQPHECCVELSSELLKLDKVSPALQLPNLRNILIYYGQNGRPDASEENSAMHLGVIGDASVISSEPNEPIYLVFDSTSVPPKHRFSPNNEPTLLWAEVTPQGPQAHVELYMRSPNGELIRRPAAHATFTIPRKDFGRYGPQWQLGSQRVDGTLLARQKAHWQGEDVFLEAHGGPEYAGTLGMQRIDFGEGEESQPLFVKENSCLVWKDDRWQQADLGEESRKYPLLCVKKVEQRLINFELWDVDGRGRLPLNLLRSSDAPVSKNLLKGLKFIGARTLSQFLFEMNKQRVVLRPGDWLWFKDGRWQLLQDPVDIKSYVDRKTIAPLFVFEGISRKDEKQVMKGTLFNASRTEKVPIEMTLSQGSPMAFEDERRAVGHHPLGQRAAREVVDKKQGADQGDSDDDE